MALTPRLIAALAFLAAAPLAAEEPVQEAPAPSSDAPRDLHPPVPDAMPQIPWPAGAPPSTAPVVVRVILTIDTSGSVKDVRVEQSGGEPFDRAVVEAVKAMHFQPARQGETPIEVALPFTHTFEPPPPPPPPGAPKVLEDAVLAGTIVERGTRTPVAGATVAALSADGSERTATTDASGAFTLAVPSGVDLEVRVAAPAHKRFVQKERLAHNESLRIKYLVDAESYGMYASVVRAERERTEVSRTTLSGRELTHVAGTFGDPFKVFTVLPGVTTVMSLLPIPIVRGSSPGNTGILLDGVRLPLLFHLLAGPSVVHPEFIDRVDFYPGNFPVTYGGYTGGIIDGVTRPPAKDESRVDLDLNLLQTGGFVRQPLGESGLTATAAARIGYPGLLMSLVTPDASLSYWDYQARIDGGQGDRGFSAFLFGARDTLQSRSDPTADLKTVLGLGFHRLDLRYREGPEERSVTWRLVLGYENTLVGDGGATDQQGPVGTTTWSATPQIRLHRKLTEKVEGNAGLDATARLIDSTGMTGSPSGNPDDVTPAIDGSGNLHNVGGFAEAVYRPIETLRLIPGLRGDAYTQGTALGRTNRLWLDPRLLARYRLSDAEVGGTWLKGAVGRYHQPPRIPFALPGVDLSSLDLGIIASTQVSAGAETRIARGVELDVQGYFSWTDPVLFELNFNSNEPQGDRAPTTPPWQPQPPSDAPASGSGFNQLFAQRKGRAYGLEVMLRKRDSERLFGWIAYTLSRSERDSADGFRPFEFDRLHVLNVVAGVRLPRNWELGGRMLLQSGTPLATTEPNGERSPPQFRFDIRVDKRAVWDSWMLDFYVDVINTTVAEESGGLIGSQSFRYLLPTVGFRAVL